MESQKSVSTSKKRERVRLYRKKMRNTQHRAGRVNRFKQIASKSNDKSLRLTSQMKVLKKTVNKTNSHIKQLQR